MIKITEVSIKIELIHADPWQEIIGEAWRHSRPNIKASEQLNYDEILGIDTPVSEIAGFVVVFKVPILFREIICSMRDHKIWARTSRVDNLTEKWQICKNTLKMKEIEEHAEQLFIESSSGERQDEFRKNLPICYMTEFTARFDLRSFIKLILYFETMKQNQPAIRKQCEEFILEAKILFDDLKINYSSLSKIIKGYDLCPIIENAGSGRIGDMITVCENMTLALRAQLIRHRTIFVKDNLSAFFGGRWHLSINSPISVQASASVDIWQKIIGKRNCWLAHTDLWSDFLGKVQVYFDKIEFSLPCLDGICPYNGDCVKRIEHKDPGVPCPRHARIHDRFHELDDDYKDKAYNYILQSKRPLDYWQQQLVLGDLDA